MQKKIFIPIALCASFLILAFQNCERNANLSISSSIEQSSSDASFKIKSNSTINQNVCVATNKVIVEFVAPQNQSILCQDQSFLSIAYSKGLTCSGGVTIADFITDQTSVPCESVTLCGKSGQIVGQTTDENGNTLFTLEYTDLPWACTIQINVNENSTEYNVTDTIIPPACNHCSDGSVTCNSCPSATPTPTPTSTPISPAANCELSGYGTLADGQFVQSYNSASVGYGNRCTQTTIECHNGILYGGNTYISSCKQNDCWPSNNPLCSVGGCGNGYGTCFEGGCADPSNAMERSYGQYCCSNRYTTKHIDAGGNPSPNGYNYCD